jgi:hypothetical protein
MAADLSKLRSVGNQPLIAQITALQQLVARSPLCMDKTGQKLVQVKAVFGTVPINAGATANITLTGPALFTSGTSYTVEVSFDGAGVPTAAAVVFNQTASGFSIKNLDGTNRNVQWKAEGV